jgi:hypothetical protein
LVLNPFLGLLVTQCRSFFSYVPFAKSLPFL